MEPWLSRITDYLLAQSWQIAILTVVVAIVSVFLRNRSAHGSNAVYGYRDTPPTPAVKLAKKEVAELLRKHGAKK